MRRNLARLVLLTMPVCTLLMVAATGARADVRCSRATGLSFHSPMKFCVRNEIYVAAVGEITPSTPDELARFLRAVVASGMEPHSVTFHSPGGSMVGGIGLGKLIRSLHLDTHVGQGSTCTSACMLAFIGGWSRKITHDGRIGNHQLRSSRTDVASIETIQDLIGYLSEYHREMNVSPLAVTTAMTRRSNEMYWYSHLEQREWGIVTRR